MNRSALIALVALSALPGMAQRQETGFLNRTLTLEGTAYRYQVYVPAEWTADKKWP